MRCAELNPRGMMSGRADKDSSDTSDSESLSPIKYGRKFTTKQQAVLTAHYNTGMKGVGEAHASRILQAAREAGLKIEQVKVKNRAS